jgi:hypothetical protein
MPLLLTLCLLAFQQVTPYDAGHDTLYRHYLLATIIGVVGGFLGIVVLIWQTWLTRISANAARDAASAARSNAEALVNAERPWIFISQAEETRVVNPRKTHVRILGRNRGRTPAEVTVISCGFRFVPYGNEPYPDEPYYPELELKYRTFVAPDETFDVYDFNCLTAMTDELWEDANRKREHLELTGHVIYRDLITGKEHETRFCYFLSSIPMVGLVRTAPRNYNQHT